MGEAKQKAKEWQAVRAPIASAIGHITAWIAACFCAQV
jgi:hypothetical protein